jgi:hypothetical protein
MDFPRQQIFCPYDPENRLASKLCVYKIVFVKSRHPCRQRDTVYRIYNFSSAIYFGRDDERREKSASHATFGYY